MTNILLGIIIVLLIVIIGRLFSSDDAQVRQDDQEEYDPYAWPIYHKNPKKRLFTPH